jgi:hypothetical protein
MKVSALFLFFAVLFSGLNAQGISVGSGNPPHPSAALDVQSVQGGLLLPRLSATERNAIVSPAVGLQIFNTSSECLEIYMPSGWRPVVCECTQPPPAPSTIQGSAVFCSLQSGVTYSVPFDPSVNQYNWSVPQGASIASGSGTNQITVNFGTQGGTISVTAQNNCGTSQSTDLTVSLQTPSATFSPTQGAISTPVTFSANPGYASYSWTFQNGSPATSASAAPQVTWATAGTYTVTLVVTGSSGCTDSVSQTVQIINCPPGSQTFSFTGGVQTFTVPACVSTVTVDIYGAQGGNDNGVQGGLGGRVQGQLTVIPGEILNIYVGGQGSSTTSASQGGYNGGGGVSATGTAGTGGGASDIRRGSTLSNRLVIAGGGGGAAGSANNVRVGGTGGGLIGGDGGIWPSWPNSGGKGGTQSAGGAAGVACCHTPTPGTLGEGGAGRGDSAGGGGGGGGYYGGGGGLFAGGGGGSSFSTNLSNGTTTSGVRSGHGQITISW